MKTLVVYDIPDDRTRTKVFETCKDYGLAHIQYSAFFGELNHNRRQELHQRLRRVLGSKEGKILICPVCDKDLALAMEIAQPEEEAASRRAGSRRQGPIIY
ncbi:MAG: CRISPR-associated endonuclease Cas2 [Bacillota bacterium]